MDTKLAEEKEDFHIDEGEMEEADDDKGAGTGAAVGCSALACSPRTSGK